MPKTILTSEDRLKSVCDRRGNRLKGLIEGKMIEYRIEVDTLQKALNLSRSAVYYRLKEPAERLNINELSILLGVLHISNEECNAVLRC